MKKFILPTFLQTKSSLGIRIQAMVWLVMAVFMIVLLILLWMYGKSGDSIGVEQVSEAEKSIATVEAINVSKKIDKLADLSDDVEPIQFETIVRDLRDYPDEFKDKVYLNDRSDKWTVQVMDVANHEVITDFLEGREDRAKFAYFRFTDQDNQSRYMLTYDEVTSLDEAMEIASVTDFGLPDSVKVAPEEMSRYISMVDNYERAQAVLDMSRNRPRSVILKPTTREIPVKRAYSNTAKRSARKSTSTSATNLSMASDAKMNEVNTPERPVTEKSLKESLEVSKDLKAFKTEQTTQQQKSTSIKPDVIKDAQKAVKSTTKSANDEVVANAQKTKNAISTPTNQNGVGVTDEPTPKPFVPNSPPN